MRNFERNRCARRSLILAAAVLASAGSARADVPPPNVVQNDWIGAVNPAPAGPYLDPANWSLAAAPSNTNNHFATINHDGIAEISADSQGAFLTLGMTYRTPTDFDKGTLNITGGTTTLGEFRVGGRESLTSFSNTANDFNDGGTGSVTQTGGTVNVTYTHETLTTTPAIGTPPPASHYEPPIQSLYIGDSGADLKATPAVNHANGSYHLVSGTVLSGLYNNDSIVVGTGVGTQATFVQDAGTTSVTSMGYVEVGRRGATGSYSIAGGSLTANASGLNSTGGNVTLGLIIGDGESAAAASLAQANGTFTSGTFTQTGGTVNVLTGVTVGRRGGVGSYSISSGSLNAATSATSAIPSGLVIGVGETAGLTGTMGTFTQTGGAVSIYNAEIGKTAGTGIYTISGGTLNATTQINLGVTAVGTGVDSGTGTLNILTNLAPGGTNPVVTIGTNFNTSIGSTSVASTGVGTLNMSAGTMTFTNAAPIFTLGNGLGTMGTVNQSGGTISLGSGTVDVDLGRNSGSGTYNLSGTGILNTVIVTMEPTLASGSASRIFNVSGGGTLNATTFTFGTTVPPAGLTRALNVSGGNVNVTGTLTAGVSGMTNISGGAVSVGSLATGTSGVVYVSGGSLSVTNTLTLATSSTLRTSVPLTLTPASIAVGTMTFQTDASTLSLAGPISGASTATVTKTGAGTLLLSGTNPYVGGFTVNAGTLQASKPTALSSYMTAGKLIAKSGGTIALNVGGSGEWTAANVDTLRTNATFNAGSALGFDTTNAGGVPFPYASNIAGALGITKLGSGSLVLSGTSTYTGGTTANAGTLNLTSAGALGSTAGALVVNNPATGTGTDVTTVNLFNGAPTATGSLSGAISTPGSGSHTSVINNPSGLNVTQTTAGTFDGVIAGAGGLTLGTGSTTLTLKGANTFTGGTTVSAGTLVAANANALAGGSLNVANAATARLQAGLTNAVTVSTVTTNASGKLDVTDNSVILHGGTNTPADLRTQIASAYAGGAWTGPGITSTTAAGDTTGQTAVGYAVAPTGATQAKLSSAAAGDLLVKYTYYGDADLSGAVTLADFNKFLTGYQAGSTSAVWSDGDFDYNGRVTLDDFTLFFGAYQNQGSPLNALGDAVENANISPADQAYFLAAISAVPEPTSLVLLGVAGAGLLARRRRSA